MSKTIPLTQGKFAIVDDEDFAALAAFRWYARRQRRGAGECWYAVRSVNLPSGPDGSRGQQKVGMHRQVLGAPRGLEVDHVNGDGLDNRRANLRIADGSQNQANRVRGRAHSSGFRGVTWHKQAGRWQAAIKVRGKNYHLGLYDTQEEAARAYDAAAVEHFGEFARPNFAEAA